jgi:hypothetical protein
MFDKLLIGILLLVSLVTANIQIGIKSGYNHSSLNATFQNSDDGLNRGGSWSGEGKPGFQIGTEVNLEVVEEILQVVSGIAYTTRGAQLSSSEGAQADYSISYFQIPLLAQYFYAVNRQQNIYFGMGPEFLLLNNVHAAVSNEPSDVSQTENGTNLVTGNFHEFDIAWNARIGYSLSPRGPLNYTIDMGLSFGLLDIDNFHAKDAPEEAEKRRFKAGVKNMNINVSLGVHFKL